MGCSERNSGTVREIGVEIQVRLTPETTWEDFKAGLIEIQEDFPHLNLDHFGDYPEDDQLMEKFFRIRILNKQDKIGTDQLLKMQSQWMEEVDRVEGFWERREKLVSLITKLTPSYQSVADANQQRERGIRAYRPRLKDTPG